MGLSKKDPCLLHRGNACHLGRGEEKCPKKSLLMVALRHNLVHFKNPKKRPSTAHSDFEQNIFFVDLHTPGLPQKTV